MTPIERISHIGTWLYVRRDKLINSLYERMHRQASVDRNPVAQALRLTYLKVEHELAGVAQEAHRVRTEHAVSDLSVQIDINRIIFQRFMSTARDVDTIFVQAEEALCVNISDAVERRDIKRFARLGGYVYWTLQFEHLHLIPHLEILGRLRLSHYSQALAELGLHVPGTPETLPDYVSRSRW